MPVVSVTGDLTAGYSDAEAWMYDRAVGAAAARLMAPALDAVVAGLPPGARLLDVGGGGGHQLVDLATRHPHLALSGVDLQPNQVARAAARLGAKGAAVQGSALALPFEDASFDAVISVASIKHWPDPAAGLAELVRVLRPGGRLCVTEVDRGATLDVAQRFFFALPVPRCLRSLAFPVFRTYVLGQGWDLDDARALAAGLPLDDIAVFRPDGLPVVALAGRKPAS